jgi:hypothetical protein
VASEDTQLVCKESNGRNGHVSDPILLPLEYTTALDTTQSGAIRRVALWRLGASSVDRRLIRPRRFQFQQSVAFLLSLVRRLARPFVENPFTSYLMTFGFEKIPIGSKSNNAWSLEVPFAMFSVQSCRPCAPIDHWWFQPNQQTKIGAPSSFLSIFHFRLTRQTQINRHPLHRFVLVSCRGW